jgi:hypothetical protein
MDRSGQRYDLGLRGSEALSLIKVMLLGQFMLLIRLSNRTALSLGSLHLMLMAIIGVWFWSSPSHFARPPDEATEFGSIECTSMALLGRTIDLSSPSLRAWSLIIYACFMAPGLNLLVPAALFLAMHIGYCYLTNSNTKKKLSTVPAYIGLMFLLAVNVVFLVDIETAMRRAKRDEEAEESQWTFGQTLAVLLLILPLRDLFSFILHVRRLKRNERYTTSLKYALQDGDMERVKKVVQFADIRVEASGMLAATLAWGKA